MNTSDRPSAPPAENSTPQGAGLATEAWILKGLNDLREDVKGIRDSISGADKRLASLEKTVMRAVYGIAGAIAVILIFWAVFQVMIRYVDIHITPKGDVTEQG